MKLIIAGSRNITDKEKIFPLLGAWAATCLVNDRTITEVVCGMARGIDTIGQEWALMNNIPVKEFPADWDKYGKAAGPIRNKQMADYADAAIVIYRPDVSKGSKNMIETMKKVGKPVYEVTI